MRQSTPLGDNLFFDHGYGRVPWGGRGRAGEATESMLVLRRSISSPIEPVASSRNRTSSATGAGDVPAGRRSGRPCRRMSAVTVVPAAANVHVPSTGSSPHRRKEPRRAVGGRRQRRDLVTGRVADRDEAPCTGCPSAPVTVTTTRPVGSPPRSGIPRSCDASRGRRDIVEVRLSSTEPATAIAVDRRLADPAGGFASAPRSRLLRPSRWPPAPASDASSPPSSVASSTPARHRSSHDPDGRRRCSRRRRRLPPSTYRTAPVSGATGGDHEAHGGGHDRDSRVHAGFDAAARRRGSRDRLQTGEDLGHQVGELLVVDRLGAGGGAARLDTRDVLDVVARAP